MLDAKRIAELTKEIDEALKLVRITPRSLIPHLQERLQYFKGNTIHRQGQNPLMTAEGPAAVNEAIEYLKLTTSLDLLKVNEDLNKAAQDHASDIGPKAIIGHIGSDGSTVSSRFARFNCIYVIGYRYGDWKGRVGENISFGDKTGIEAIVSLIIDDGFQSRGHCKNLFETEFKEYGVGIAVHRAFGIVIVIDLATEFLKKGNATEQKVLKGFDKQFAEMTLLPKKTQSVTFIDDPDMPPGTVEKHVSKSIKQVQGVKYIVETKRYILKDGSVKIYVQEEEVKN